MNIDYVYDALTALRGALPLLPEALIPGTPRRWSQHELTEEQRDRMDALARVEREAKMENLSRGIKALGDGKAPLRLDVLVTTGEIHAGVADLEDAACDQLQITPLAGASTEQRIARVIGLLDRVAAWPDLADHVTDEAVRLRRLAGRAIGDNEAILRIDARCSICDARSLRAFPDRGVVVCVNKACRCAYEDCPCWWDPPRNHRWPEEQWVALALAIGADQ
ncbi:hypothetical protein [Acrocarpospora sp. B8E8]|uniref:hypothetical protein n=1 Tax=Acrocarpospora sp. B8E8 TaxID=3153572 RepID=UPI00325E1B00